MTPEQTKQEAAWRLRELADVLLDARRLSDHAFIRGQFADVRYDPDENLKEEAA